MQMSLDDFKNLDRKVVLDKWSHILFSLPPIEAVDVNNYKEKSLELFIKLEQMRDGYDGPHGLIDHIATLNNTSEYVYRFVSKPVHKPVYVPKDWRAENIALMMHNHIKSN